MEIGVGEFGADGTDACFGRRAFLKGALALGVVAGIGAGGVSVPGGNEMTEVGYLRTPGGAWRLVLADVRGDGRRVLVCGLYGGSVLCLDPETGKQIWEAPLTSFPFNLAAADLDADGRDEVLAVTAGGVLQALSAEGQPLWSHSDPMPLYDVGAGRLLPDGGVQVVCGGVGGSIYAFDAAGGLLAQRKVKPMVLRLAVADMDGDGRDEVLVLNGNSELLRFQLNGGELVEAGRTHLGVPADRKSWHNPALRFGALAIEVGDLTGDSAPEVMLGSWCTNDEQVLCLNAAGQPLWLSDPQGWVFHGEAYTEFYSTAFPRVLQRLPERPGRGVLVVTGGVVKLLDTKGRRLEEAYGRVGFTDVAVDGGTVYLGSSPNGDDTLYRLRLDERWAGSVEGVERQGLAKTMGESLALLRRQVLDYKGTAPAGFGPYVIQDLRVRPNDRSAALYHRYADWHHERFPYPNLRYVASAGVVEQEPVLDENGHVWSQWQWNQAKLNGTMTRDQVVGVARWAEKAEVPLVVNMGHGCTPFLHLETAEEMLKAAPRYLDRFTTSEDSGPDVAPRYLRHYFSRLLDLCAEHGKRATTRNKAAWWMAIPAMPDAFDSMFGGKRERPCFRPRRTRTPAPRRSTPWRGSAFARRG